MIKGDPVMTHFPNVETERLYLRELTLADRQVVFEHFAEPDVTRFMDIEPCRDVKKQKESVL
jgi:[ribosomal protein S5]-alanine N-acetyltransferase